MEIQSNIIRIVGQVLMVPTAVVRPMKGQPRKYFDPVELQELADNLKEQGQIQPAIVKELKPTKEDPYLYELISGERRWQALPLAGMPEIKIIIRPEMDDAQQFTMAVTVNNYGVPLTVLETAMAVGRFKNEFNKSLIEIAKIFGKKSTAWSFMHLKILSLHPKVLKLLGPETPEEKRIPLNTAINLYELPQDEQFGFAEMCSEQGLSAIQVKHLILNRLAQHGIKRKSRLNEEFQSTLRFFHSTNIRIEQFVDHTDERVTLLFKNRKPGEISELLREVKDCVDNLQVTLKAFHDEAGKAKPMKTEVVAQ